VPVDTDEPDTIYRVVVNHEEQYSIWPADRELPAGWREEGTSGARQACLDHIDQVWTDLRPLSLRRFMEEQERLAAAGEAAEDLAEESTEPEGESLVSRLSHDQPVEVSLRPDRTAPALREAIDRGYVFVRFTETQGGTELGVRLDQGATDLSEADFDRPGGRVTLVGDLILDFEPVRCIAEIDLTTLTGQGRLAVRQLDAG
jgi:uncharacterized protein YbdZ (MbtH family)